MLQTLETLFKLGFESPKSASIAFSRSTAILTAGARWLLVPMELDGQEESGRICYLDLSATADGTMTPRPLLPAQSYDPSTMTFSGVQTHADAQSLSFSFAQVYRVKDESEAPEDCPWLLHVWRVEEVTNSLRAECMHTMRLGSLEDSEARIAIYDGSLRDDMLAFSINMESDDFSVVAIVNWREVGDDEDGYEGKIFPRLGERQKFESLTLLPDSRILLSSGIGRVSTIHYDSLNTSVYPEYDGSFMSDAEVIQTPISIDSRPKEPLSPRFGTTFSTTTFPSNAMPALRAIQCQ